MLAQLNDGAFLPSDTKLTGDVGNCVISRLSFRAQNRLGGLTPELSRAAKQRLFERIVSLTDSLYRHLVDGSEVS